MLILNYFCAMHETGLRLKWFCCFFVGTILLSSLELTVIGIHSSDETWFEYFSDAMGEEEAEDSEKEEKSNKREFDSSDSAMTAMENSSDNEFAHADMRYHSVFREVFSPPPEAYISLS